MDVPEAGKHGKKSTSQKLEDQKKVGKLLLFFSFFFSTFAALKFASFMSCCSCWYSKNRQLWLLLMSICICTVALGCYGVVQLSCCLFEKKKKQNVFPVAAAVVVVVVCFPTCSFASYLLIAIYKDLGDGVSLSSVSSVFHLDLHAAAMGRARHSPSGNTYLFFICDAIYAHWKWVIPRKLDKWFVCKTISCGQ